MAGKIKVSISNKQKKVALPTGMRLLIRRCCNAVLTEQHFDGDAEVSVTLVDDEAIRKLNHIHRSIDRATDVLSFPLGESGEYDINLDTGRKQLGDIVISVERALSQSQEYGHSFKREMGYLTVHSMLHLLGYDHVAGGAEAIDMRNHEETVMAMVDLPR
ncbi:MAG: rRNA maturation RNase YbeY [Firmicutes bacterium]|nr:rRNA maturation RNase YbeY [Bacillota bacterium]